MWLVRHSGIEGKGKECRSREGELNADCESLSSDLTNFTILERTVTNKGREVGRGERKTEKSRMDKAKDDGRTRGMGW